MCLTSELYSSACTYRSQATTRTKQTIIPGCHNRPWNVPGAKASSNCCATWKVPDLRTWGSVIHGCCLYFSGAECKEANELPLSSTRCPSITMHSVRQPVELDVKFYGSWNQIWRGNHVDQVPTQILMKISRTFRLGLKAVCVLWYYITRHMDEWVLLLKCCVTVFLWRHSIHVSSAQNGNPRQTGVMKVPMSH